LGDVGLPFWLFLIVGMMKGHVGGGSGFRWPSGVGGSVKAKPFHVSQYANTVMYIVQGTAPGVTVAVLGYSTWYVDGHELESLILAQNERWRHA
jgi:hypothetical protein